MTIMTLVDWWLCIIAGCTHRVVVTVQSESSAHAKVTDLGEGLTDEQDVASCEITMHEVVALQVRHSIRDLTHQFCHLWHRHLSVTFRLACRHRAGLEKIMISLSNKLDLFLLNRIFSIKLIYLIFSTFSTIIRICNSENK